MYLKAIFSNTGGKLQAINIKVACPQCEHIVHTDHKKFVFVFHLHMIIDPSMSVLQTDSIYPRISKIL